MSQPTSLTPSIRIYGTSTAQQHVQVSDPTRPLSHPSTPSLSSPAVPMPIRGNPSRDQVPPPLPPPRIIEELNKGQDPGWQWANGKVGRDLDRNEDTRFGTFVKPGSSLLRDSRSGSTASDIAPETNAPLSLSLPSHQRFDASDDDNTKRPGLPRLQSEKQLTWRSAHNSAEQFDRHLLNKLDSANSTRRNPNSSSLPKEFTVAGRDDGKRPGNLKPLSLSDNRYNGPESPRTRWHGTSPPALSPASASFRSPLFDSQVIDRALNSSSGIDHHDEPQNGRAPHRNSVEQSVFSDSDFGMDDSGMRDLNLSDKSPSSIGDDGSHSGRNLKRRAPSPTLDGPRDDRVSPHGNYNDLYHRRSMQMLQSRYSPGSRIGAHGESLSSTISFPQSIGSQWGASVTSSATSYRSEKISPGPISPPVDPEFVQYSPYSRRNGEQDHGKQPDNTQDSPHGGFACECCMKKPKRFRTLAELRAHEAEKLYKCQFCPNRFKNKNEAERHQNSLHLRRFSWSCASLGAVQNAFHPSTVHRGAIDVCGYCGAEFPNQPEPDWNVRTEHLVVAHKYGECNQHKKFFRADHFRQHLKHSHGAMSGKWTNILETACVRDEPLPTPTGNSTMGQQGISIRGLTNGEDRSEVS